MRDAGPLLAQCVSIGNGFTESSGALNAELAKTPLHDKTGKMLTGHYLGHGSLRRPLSLVAGSPGALVGPA